MAKIVDQHGNPIDQSVLKEPQTSRVATLQNEYLTSNLDGLTPARLAATLRNADNGDLMAQHRLFADMEERDAHLFAEMSKRKLALLGLDWSIEPPRNATAAEKAHAEWLTEVLTDAVDPIEDLILALMDGVGHGFAPVELEWRQEGSELLPAFLPRPQEWFRLDQQRREIRLRDMSADGAPLAAFGWVFHTHGKAKTGYNARLGIHRVLSWPFLYKCYAIGDFAEFLETFGLPIILGKYFNGASKEEKASLMRAVTALGHDARAIMPQDMQLEVQKITGGGDSTPHLAMVDWAERSESKAILGQTMSAESKSSGLGSGNADLHREVREDIMQADAREIAGTITRDLLYPLIALNRGNIDGLRRCPRLVFDTGEAEDIKLLADSLPKLVGVGMRIKTEWAHEKLRIPMGDDQEPILVVSAPANVLAPELRPEPGKQTPVTPKPQTGSALPSVEMVALSANVLPESDPGQAALNTALASLPAGAIDAAMRVLIKPALTAIADGATPDEAADALLTAFPELDDSALQELLARAIFISDIWGRLSAHDA